MDSARGWRIARLPGPLELGLGTTVLVLAAAGWALTGDRMGGMDAGPGTDLGGPGWFIGVWITMMAAMMFPSVLPMVLAHLRIEGGDRNRHAAATGATALFVAGYLVAWAAAGLLGYTIDQGGRALDLHFLGWEAAGPYVAGGVILGAAIYQVTRQKDCCLRQCRSPLALRRLWHPGHVGALRTGIEHGGVCVGCCWALMAALFALGVMNVAWMALIATLIAVEKLLPWHAIANRGVAVLLAVLAVAVAFAPEKVPGLTIPGSPAAHSEMKSM
jgi:predicted metal-binding membrane protein